VRLRALLIRLAATANDWVPVSRLVEALWSHDPPTDELNALQSLISRLRRTLPTPGLIESGPAGYRLTLNPDDVDAIEFEHLISTGRRHLNEGHPDTASTLLSQALALWRGTPLTEVADADYAQAWTQRLENLHLTAIEARAAAGLQLGHHQDLIPELEDLTSTYPLREHSHELLIKALAGTGRQGEALATYDRLRQSLATELGLDPPQHLQQLHAAVLRNDPSLHPATTAPQPNQQNPQRRRRSNLRSALTSFIGRQHDVQHLQDLLHRSRLVTLVGAGGAGKTRLATEVAAGLPATNSPVGPSPGADGVWMVELAPVTDPNDVPSLLLSSIGARDTTVLERQPAGSRDVLGRLVETIARHDIVLVLDNCEHLVDTAAKLAEYLLGQCPGLRVLATSREPLGIMGESLWPVHPLAAPAHDDDLGAATSTPAVLLFADRAALVRPGFTVNALNATAVFEICRRLDGLPLAIELAAARLRHLPVEAVAARLDDRFRLLSGGSRTALPRHQTLRAVVTWSWDLLTDTEQRLAERLSVFPGGATGSTAEAICTQPTADLDDVIPTDAVLELLAALTDKSLLVVVENPAGTGSGTDQAEPRYRMLETIREFAAERLVERGESLATRKAHARHFLDLTETAEPRLRGSDQLVWLDRLNAEHDNLLAALRFAAETGDALSAIRMAASLGWYWTLLDRHDEAANWLELALSVPGERPAEAYVTVRLLHAISRTGAGFGLPTPELLDELLGLVRQLDVHTGNPLLILAEPIMAMLRDDEGEAQRAVDRNLDHPDPWSRAMLYLMSTLIAENDGDLGLAGRRLPLALEGFRQLGDRWGMGTSLAMAGQLHSLNGDTEAAITALEEARTMLAELQAREDQVFTLIRIATMRLRAPEPDFEAIRRDLNAAQQIGQTSGSSTSLAFAQFGLSVLAYYEGRLPKAQELAAEALALIDQGPYAPPQFKAMILSGLAGFDVAQGNRAQARPRLQEALKLARGARDMPVIATICTVAADLNLSGGDPRAAAELLGVGIALRGIEDLGDPELKRIAAEAGAALGGPEYARARSRGMALSRDEALTRLESSLHPPT